MATITAEASFRTLSKADAGRYIRAQAFRDESDLHWSESRKAVCFEGFGRPLWVPAKLLRVIPATLPHYPDEIGVPEWFLLKQGVSY